MAMVTKIFRMVTYRKEVPLINSHDPLVTRTFDFVFFWYDLQVQILNS